MRGELTIKHTFKPAFYFALFAYRPKKRRAISDNLCSSLSCARPAQLDFPSARAVFRICGNKEKLGILSRDVLWELDRLYCLIWPSVVIDSGAVFRGNFDRFGIQIGL